MSRQHGMNGILHLPKWVKVILFVAGLLLFAGGVFALVKLRFILGAVLIVLALIALGCCKSLGRRVKSGFGMANGGPGINWHVNTWKNVVDVYGDQQPTDNTNPWDRVIPSQDQSSDEQ